MELKEFIEQTLEDYRRRVYGAIAPLSPEDMAWRPDPEANSISFLVWHVARVEDRWTQGFAKGVDEVWIRDGWYERLGLPKGDTGLFYTAEQVSAFPEVPKESLQEYFDSVREETLSYLRGLGPEHFEVVLERTPFPEFETSASYFEGWTIARMFRQLIGEEDQHLGQVSFIRGLRRGLGK